MKHSARILMSLSVFVFLLAVGIHSVRAEIIEKDVPCEMDKSGKCHHWWPKISAIEGWHEEDASEINLATLVQDGFKLENAPVILYANAVHKSNFPDTKSVDDFIAKDRGNSNSVTSDEGTMKTGDDQELRVISFFPSKQEKEGKWEMVAYGNEGDFYLILAVATKSEADLKKAKDDYKTFVEAYKAKP